MTLQIATVGSRYFHLRYLPNARTPTPTKSYSSALGQTCLLHNSKIKGKNALFEKIEKYFILEVYTQINVKLILFTEDGFAMVPKQ